MKRIRGGKGLAGAAMLAVAALGTVLAIEPATAVGFTPQRASTDATTTSSPLQVLTIGDSIMNGFGLAAGQSWPDLLGQAEGWTVTNAACDGAGVLQVGNSNECASDFAGIISTTSDLHPDIVIFEGSSNDFGIGNDALLAATMTELQTIHSTFPNAQIVGFSMLWGYTTPPAQTADIDAQVQQAVEAVGGTYIDLGQPMSGHPELMQASDVHPTAAGQAVLEADIQAALQPTAKAAADALRAAADRAALLAERVRLELVQ